MDKVIQTATQYRAEGLDLAEDWIDTMHDTFQEHTSELIAANNKSAVFKILRKVQQQTISSSDEAAPHLQVLLDGAIDAISDQVDEIIKAKTSGETQAVISSIMQKGQVGTIDKDSSVVKGVLENLLAEKQDAIAATVNSESALSMFLVDLKEQLTSAVVSKLAEADDPGYVLEHEPVFYGDSKHDVDPLGKTTDEVEL